MRGARSAFALLTRLLLIAMVERVVWLDETGFRPWMQRTHGRAKRGKRVEATGRSKSRQYTLVAAMDVTGIRASLVFPKGLTYERWKCFVHEHLIPSLHPGELLLLDNLNIHTQATDVLDSIRKARVAIIFLPPASPQANPIEYAFSLFKTAVRADFPKNARQLRSSISNALRLLTPQHAHSFIHEAFRHALSW